MRRLLRLAPVSALIVLSLYRRATSSRCTTRCAPFPSQVIVAWPPGLTPTPHPGLQGTIDDSSATGQKNLKFDSSLVTLRFLACLRDTSREAHTHASDLPSLRVLGPQRAFRLHPRRGCVPHVTTATVLLARFDQSTDTAYPPLESQARSSRAGTRASSASARARSAPSSSPRLSATAPRVLGLASQEAPPSSSLSSASMSTSLVRHAAAGPTGPRPRAPVNPGPLGCATMPGALR